MLSMRNDSLQYISIAFLSDDIETTTSALSKLGVETRNNNGEFKPFNEVMEQIYDLWKSNNH